MKFACGLMAILLVLTAEGWADLEPSEELASLKKEIEAAWEMLDLQKPDATEVEQKAAADRYDIQTAGVGRRVIALAQSHPDAPETPEALVWFLDRIGRYGAKTDAQCDAAFDLLAARYLDSEAILPVIRTAWINAGWTWHVEAFLRAAVERSSNPRSKALACFTLGRHQHQLIKVMQYIDDPIRGKEIESRLGPDKVRRIRAVDLAAAKREAAALYERTSREFADSQPMGPDFPPLGEQAIGALYRLHNLEVGCTVPELEGEDVDGKPLKLSDFRGKVVVISFWATWCGPCMGMVPQEKALVERMKGRPFVLIGVNGDEKRSKAGAACVKEGITWRSFADAGPHGPISTRWGVSAWPTVYLIDAKGTIRNENLRGDSLDRAVEALVEQTEATSKSDRR